MFDEPFLDSLPLEKAQGMFGAVELLTNFDKWLENKPLTWKNHIESIEMLGVCFEYLEAIDVSFEELEPQNDVNSARNQITAFVSSHLSSYRKHLESIEAKNSLANSRERARFRFQSVFSYEFEDEEFDRVQELVNELREAIIASDEFEPEHKQRILKRLEKLQQELHKQMSDMDRFYAMFVEMSVAARKVGTNLKPIVDRVRELTQIAYDVQIRAEGLPPGRGLPFKSEDDKLE